MTANKIVIITAPSGSGKTTLVKQLLASCPQLKFSISACTRPPRHGEEHGRDYYFYSEDEFKSLIDKDAFVEWEMVYTGKYYGTLTAELQRIWDNNNFPLVDIDVQGALSIRNKYPDQAITIFIEAPSLDVLKQRLLQRGTETPQSLQERLDKAKIEMTFAYRFDRVIVNDDLQVAAQELITTVQEFLQS